MRAVVRDTWGSAAGVHLTRVPVPVLTAADDVLVQVHAAGAARGVWHMMTGRPYLMRVAFGLRRPRNPGLGNDLAGTVVAVGKDVTRFSAGDNVFGVGTSTFADYALAPQGKLARMPVSTTFEEAAVVPVSGMTALQALRDAGRIERGQTVLVIGASGGVGSYAVQLAKAFGAEVTGVCSTAKQDLVRSLGADHVIDYTTDDFAADGRRYDLVLDVAGNPSVSRLRRALTPTGTAVIVGGEGGGSLTGGMDRQLRATLLTPFVSQRLTMLVNDENAADLERLAELIDAGAVTPGIDRTYRLEETPQAMKDMEDGLVRGKIAITP